MPPQVLHCRCRGFVEKVSEVMIGVMEAGLEICDAGMWFEHWVLIVRVISTPLRRSLSNEVLARTPMPNIPTLPHHATPNSTTVRTIRKQVFPRFIIRQAQNIRNLSIGLKSILSRHSTLVDKSNEQYNNHYHQEAI
ncbi:hypothetical protein ACFX13_013466 [Malus domestica]